MVLNKFSDEVVLTKENIIGKKIKAKHWIGNSLYFIPEYIACGDIGVHGTMYYTNGSKSKDIWRLDTLLREFVFVDKECTKQKKNVKKVKWYPSSSQKSDEEIPF